MKCHMRGCPKAEEDASPEDGQPTCPGAPGGPEGVWRASDSVPGGGQMAGKRKGMTAMAVVSPAQAGLAEAGACVHQELSRAAKPSHSTDGRQWLGIHSEGNKPDTASQSNRH